MKTYSITLPANPEAAELLRALKGAPLSCLVGLWLCHPTPVGRETLALFTGYKKDAITAAMTLLVNVYRLATRVGRYESWGLTTKGIQLRLPFFTGFLEEKDSRAPHEGDFSAFPPSSSSSFIDLSSSDSSTEITTTTTASEGGKIAFPPRILEIIDEWFDGCPKSLIEKAMRTALERGDPLARIEYRSIAWTLYTQSEHGKNIKARSIFVAKKIEKDERCQDLFELLDDHFWVDRKPERERLEALHIELGGEPLTTTRPPSIIGKLAKPLPGAWYTADEAELINR